jgi:hypothetical protein
MSLDILQDGTDYSEFGNDNLHIGGSVADVAKESIQGFNTMRGVPSKSNEGNDAAS